ncbi:hypothetical protein AX774_g654 [Zancudomyces culisetae]|uniref:Uncharacterized protein n=1 Tax=Zancudomyces culisetae TaxID=1213189 RepID=A0A1R1PXU7_ZANCU|nr:hypothetical protein AX774_g654 [Zancudomyces culisetae]|eukprot:OMH85780.1 hypothetical protein AX774_g654 [Zancudomyces culisetae]
MWMDFTDIKDSVVGNGVKKGGSGNYLESMVPKSDSITQRSVRSERAIDRRTDMDPEVFDYQTYRGSYDENVGCISRHFYKNANANETVAIDTRRDAYFLNTMGDKLGKTFPGEHIGTGNAVNYHRFGGILRNSSVPGTNLQDSNKRINRLQPIDLSEETTQLYGTYEAHGSYHVNTYNKSITQHTRDILEYKGVDNFIDKSGSDERKTADSYAVGLDKSELCFENVTGSLMANKDNGLVKFASQKAVALHNHAYTERTGDLMEDKASSLLHNERSPSSPFLSGQSTRVFEEKATHTKEPENDKVLNKRNELSRASIPLWHEEMAIPEGERVQSDSVQNTIGRHNQEDSYNTLGSLHSTMNENGISNGTHSLYGSSSPPRTKCYEPYSNSGLLSQLSIISGELDSELPNH